MTSFHRPGLPRRILLAAALWAASVGAGGAYAATGRVSVEVNGQRRAATLVERSRLKRAPRALIIMLRAPAPSRAGLTRLDRFLGLDEATGPGIVLAFPSPVENRWRVGPDRIDDAAFIRALASKLISDGVADRRRVYLAGASSGGLLALRILCEGGGEFAAGAALLANLPASVAKTCKPAHPMGFLLLSGAADPLMPFQGGLANLPDFKEEVVSADATLAPFLAAAGCGKPSSHELPDRDPKDGSRVTVERFAGCKAPVEFYRINGGGHSLPGRPARAERGAPVGAHNNDIDTAHVLAEFFRRAGR